MAICKDYLVRYIDGTNVTCCAKYPDAPCLAANPDLGMRFCKVYALILKNTLPMSHF